MSSVLHMSSIVGSYVIRPTTNTISQILWHIKKLKGKEDYGLGSYELLALNRKNPPTTLTNYIQTEKMNSKRNRD